MMHFQPKRAYDESADFAKLLDPEKLGTTPPTAASAIQQIETSPDLDASTKRAWISALRAIVRASGVASDALILAPQELRKHVVEKPATAWGLKASTRDNYLYRLREILRRLDVIDVPAPDLDPAWRKLRMRADSRTSMGLAALMRFCTLRQIAPLDVTEATMEVFEHWLVHRTIIARPRRVVTTAVRAWRRAAEEIGGWPTQKLELTSRRLGLLPLSSFPEPLQHDVAKFFDRISGEDLNDFFGLESEAVSVGDGDDEPDADTSHHKFSRSQLGGGLRETTLCSKRQLLKVALNALVRAGTLQDEIASLKNLVHPLDQAKKLLGQLLKEHGNKTTPTIGHVAELLRQIAAHHVGLPRKDVAQFRKWRKNMSVLYSEMTEKNQRLVATATDTANLHSLLALPAALWAEAQSLGATKRGACAAQRALLLELLIKCLPRLNNLLSIEIDKHLLRPDPRSNAITAIILSGSLIKNGRTREFPVTPKMSEMIEVWVTSFRAVLAAPGNRYLFPGKGHGPMTRAGVRDTVKTITGQRIGIAISPHGFRHIGAALYGEEFPEDAQGLTRALGHQEPKTAARAYTRPKNMAAHRKLDELIEAKRAMLVPKPRAKQVPKRPKPGGAVTKHVGRPGK